MSYRPKPLTHYERGFVLGASFLSAGAFVLGGHKLLTGSFPLYTYVFFLATLTMCPGGILRYFILARVFRTEKNLWAWSLSMTIALLGPITVYQALFWTRVVSLYRLVGRSCELEDHSVKERHPQQLRLVGIAKDHSDSSSRSASSGFNSI